MLLLTDRDLQLLKALRHHKFLDVAQLTDLVMPGSGNTRVVRERMNRLSHAGYAKKANQKVANELQTALKRVYVPTINGCAELAARTGDPAFHLDRDPPTHQWMFFDHFLAVSDFHIALDRAFAGQDVVTPGCHYLEHDIIDPADGQGLFTIVEDHRRTVCVADFAFELLAGKFRRAYYVEREMGTDTPNRIASKKTPGYTGLSQSGLFRLHFPQAQDFRVLVVVPSARFRDALRQAVKNHPGHHLWLFLSAADMKPDERLLFEPLIYTCTEGPCPLVNRAALSVVPSGAGGREHQGVGGAQ